MENVAMIEFWKTLNDRKRTVTKGDTQPAAIECPWEDDTNRALNLLHIETGNAVKAPDCCEEKGCPIKGNKAHVQASLL